MDQLLSIGEFSQRCGISPNRLRSYADSGVLPAAAVDADTGYRYYSPAQLDRARTIDLLRDGGISIAEIRDFLRRPSPAIVQRWIREVDEEADRRKSALRAIGDHLDLDTAPARAGASDVTGGTMNRSTTPAARSERGRSRKINQDAHVATPALAMVADGMGGGPLGERASSIAVDEIRRFIASGGPLHQAVQQANRSVWEQAQSDERMAGMGTTVVAAAFNGESAVIANVGDSRAYLLRRGSLRQLTEDDNVVSELVRLGQLAPAAAAQHPHRHVLTKVLGVAPDVEPTTIDVPTEVGDRLLLCTDGVTGELDDEELRRILDAAPTAAQAIDAIFDAMVHAAQPDDATAVVIDIGPPG